MGIDVRKARYAVDCAGSQIKVFCGLFIATGYRVRPLDQILACWDEFVCIFFAVAIVYAFLDEGVEDGLEVLEFAVVEGVEGAGAGELPPGLSLASIDRRSLGARLAREQ